MRIALFPNDKGGNDKRPDYRGTCQIAGVKYKLSVWNRQSQRGPFLSGSVELDNGEKKQAAQPEQLSREEHWKKHGTLPPAEPNDAPKDDVPF